MASSGVPMEFEEIARLVNQVALEQKGRPLKDVERLVLRGAWENQTYGSMAKQTMGYSEDYLKKDVGPKLWHFLSDLVDTHQRGLKVTKRNIQNVLREWAHQNQSSLMNNSVDSALLSESADIRPGEYAARCRVRELPLGDGVDFYGRSEEVATLTQWLSDGAASSCRLIVLWGLAGVGKTALATQVINSLNLPPEQCGYLELPDQPTPVEVLHALESWLGSTTHLSPSQSPSLDWIMTQLSQRRYLLVFDRLETLFIPNQLAGTFRPNTELIQQLFLQLASSPHQSCVLALSREKPVDLPQWLGSRVREYPLKELGLEEVKIFLQQQGIGPIPSEDLNALVDRYGSSPLLLRNLATTLKDVYQGQIKPFLEQAKITLPVAIRRSLTETLNRLSPEEQGLLYWLALAHDSVALDSLDQIVQFTPGSTVGQSLLGRSLCLIKWVEGGS
ncbi:MAG TPA: AAA family ATPase, partial [Leptolyngbyaceae cyanobacterium M65_K2018_010]|nr:AAA family ATPase [Leptolyngbyaceae cyanobacterium M65_K2018_010]